REPGHLFAVESISEAMVVAVMRKASGRRLHAKVSDRRVLAALDLIHSSYAERLGVGALARAAGMSRFHFSRLFREEVGAAPYQYVLAFRLDRAAELLSSGRRGVTEAAIAVGFEDPGRFARMFKERFGSAPSVFARRG